MFDDNVEQQFMVRTMRSQLHTIQTTDLEILQMDLVSAYHQPDSEDYLFWRIVIVEIMGTSYIWGWDLLLSAGFMLDYYPTPLLLKAQWYIYVQTDIHLKNHAVRVLSHQMLKNIFYNACST